MDSLDLTFVRCPSCRSLVPAISTRCRMCGASLEATAAADASSSSLIGSVGASGIGSGSFDSSNPKSSGDSSAGLLAKSGVGGKQTSAPGAGTPDSEKPASERSGALAFDDASSNSGAVDDTGEELLVGYSESATVTGEDPLSAYVEEISSAGASESGALEIAGNAAPGKIGAGKSSENVAASEAAKGTNAATGKDKSAQAAVVRTELSTTGKADVAGSGNGGSATAKPAETNSNSAARQPFEARKNTNERRFSQAPSVVNKNLVNKIQVNQAQSESEVLTDRDSLASSIKEDNQNNNRRVDMKGSDSRSSESRGGASEGRGSNESRFSAAPNSAGAGSTGGSSAGGSVSGNAAVARSSSIAVVPSGSAAANNSVGGIRTRESASRESGAVFGSGHLVGWLVSYSDARGTSLELREGKFFVTAKSIKENDLVLDERSVSTPHALVGCGRDGSLTIQDLMSERGVFVRRRGSNQYRQEEEAIPVDHGDWLRFGDLEFLVVLIPAGIE